MALKDTATQMKLTLLLKEPDLDLSGQAIPTRLAHLLLAATVLAAPTIPP